MRIIPYISFNGNCSEAVAFYEKVFNVKAQIRLYKDAPPDSGIPMSEINEKFVLHAQFEIDGKVIMLSDTLTENPIRFGENVAITLEFDNVETAKAAFNALKEGGEVSMELEETFWSKCFGSLTDKFGIGWNISLVE